MFGPIFSANVIGHLKILHYPMMRLSEILKLISKGGNLVNFHIWLYFVQAWSPYFSLFLREPLLCDLSDEISDTQQSKIIAS